ncbi:hypothetical protein QLX08_010500 [Tetragonisca angustula]|uniref:Uncharacterized protein n=1 Tax=Tetragonisca angustula TaxID=166442 RepID=A0AAW0ZC32_9HYME
MAMKCNVIQKSRFDKITALVTYDRLAVCCLFCEVMSRCVRSNPREIFYGVWRVIREPSYRFDTRMISSPAGADPVICGKSRSSPSWTWKECITPFNESTMRFHNVTLSINH